MNAKLNSPKLNTRLLKAVSRSFYLSIRLMPAKLRPAIGVAYMLARTSDTIADTESAPPQVRLRRLAEFERIIKGGATPQAITHIQRDIRPDHPGEKTLIDTMPQVLESFQSLDGWDWKEIADLMSNIIRGQSMDLEVFQRPGLITALPDANMLEDYIYLVAGCVGEWWTRMCLNRLPRYSKIDAGELTELGNHFGKGLQLVNVLRDIPADLAAGRCYLPESELKNIGTTAEALASSPTDAQPVFDVWEQRARELLDSGRHYILSIRSRRTRMACYIPWRLGNETLDLLKQNPPLSTGTKTKVSRSSVRSALFAALGVAFSDRRLMET
jgi:farnesyl-diphosphate farnesyltransferase